MINNRVSKNTSVSLCIKGLDKGGGIGKCCGSLGDGARERFLGTEVHNGRGLQDPAHFPPSMAFSVS